MTSYNLSAIVGTTVTFNAANDVLTISGDPTAYAYANNSTGGLVITNSAGVSTVLAGFTLANITTSNFLFSGSQGKFFSGDNTTGTTDDALAQIATGPLDRVNANTTDRDANNVIYGLGEGDTIKIGSGNNIIYGGAAAADTADGSDTITIDGTGTTSGNNLIYANAGNDTVLFTDPIGTGKATTIYGGNGNDDVDAGAGAGTLIYYGGDGNDTLNASTFTGNVTVYGGTGQVDTLDDDDLFITGLGNTIVFATAGNDVVQINDFTATFGQTVYGGLGNDSFFHDADGTGATGSLLVFGQAGTDSFDMTGHFGNATIVGGSAGVDTADGADNFLFGTANAGAHMVFYGNAGNDTFTSTAALAAGETVTIYGGLGTDVIAISGDRSATSNITLFGNEGNDSITVNNTGLTGVAPVTFGVFEATDKLTATLSGGAATDLVVTGLGSSVTITNAAGNDTFVFTNYTGNFTSANLVLSDGSLLLTNINGAKASLTGTANNDQIIAGGLGDTLSGGAGNDEITGGDGADSITGGDGADSINADEGNDTIDGGLGLNTIDGGTGSDLITGGADNDSIVGSNGNDTLIGGLGIDTITGGNENDTFRYAIVQTDAVDTNVDLITDAFVGVDAFDFSDLTVANLRGTGVDFTNGNAGAAQVMGANVGMYVATNAAADFTEANVYTALAGIADDLAVGDSFYLMISNGTDARLVLITNTANAGLLAADDTMVFVARLAGVDTADLAGLSAGNFDDF